MLKPLAPKSVQFLDVSEASTSLPKPQKAPVIAKDANPKAITTPKSTRATVCKVSVATTKDCFAFPVAPDSTSANTVTVTAKIPDVSATSSPISNQDPPSRPTPMSLDDSNPLIGNAQPPLRESYFT
jgi:hypothetical protein